MPPNATDLEFLESEVSNTMQCCKQATSIEAPSFHFNTLSLKIFNYCKEKNGLQDDSNVVFAYLPQIRPECSIETRFSIVSVLIICITGFVLGGLLSNFLNIFAMGGDILHIIVICALFYISDYIAENKKLRKALYIFLGAAASIEILRKIILGKFVNIDIQWFKSLFDGRSRKQGGPGEKLLLYVLILLGAFVFMCDKRRISNVTFNKNRTLLEARKLFTFYDNLLALYKAKDLKIKSLNDMAHSMKCHRNGCKLAINIIPMLEFMKPEHKAYLSEILNDIGYQVNCNEKYIIWDDAKYERYYAKIGMITNGEKCVILKPYIILEDAVEKINRGYVQKA